MGPGRQGCWLQGILGGYGPLNTATATTCMMGPPLFEGWKQYGPHPVCAFCSQPRLSLDYPAGWLHSSQRTKSAALSTVATATSSPQEPGNCCPLQQSQAPMSTGDRIPETTSSNMISCPRGSASWLGVPGFCKKRLPHICFGALRGW